MWKRSRTAPQGLEVLKTLPDTPARAQHELTLHLALGAALQMTKGFAAPKWSTPTPGPASCVSRWGHATAYPGPVRTVAVLSDTGAAPDGA